MRFNAREKVTVRRALLEIKKAANTAHASGFAHPETVPGSTPSQTLESIANYFASIWGIDLSPAGDGATPNPHTAPRVGFKLREKLRNEQAQKP